MLVTFTTKAYADIVMFGDVAKDLLELMGHSGTVPGAIAAESVPVALASLRAAAARVPDRSGDDSVAVDNSDARDGPPVALAQRAYPLIELLRAAGAEGAGVSWRAN
jgi:hypothetical protein